jgi:hypothetical protein
VNRIVGQATPLGTIPPTVGGFFVMVEGKIRYKQHVNHMGMLGYLVVFGSAMVAFYPFGTSKRTVITSKP